MKHLLVLLIRIYQKWISPLSPPCCRYYPSCSCYAKISVERFGAVRGSVLAVSRILRCHPWAKGGIDEVPDAFRWKDAFHHRTED